MKTYNLWLEECELVIVSLLFSICKVIPFLVQHYMKQMLAVSFAMTTQRYFPRRTLMVLTLHGLCGAKQKVASHRSGNGAYVVHKGDDHTLESDYRTNGSLPPAAFGVATKRVSPVHVHLSSSSSIKNGSYPIRRLAAERVRWWTVMLIKEVATPRKGATTGKHRKSGWLMRRHGCRRNRRIESRGIWSLPGWCPVAHLSILLSVCGQKRKGAVCFRDLRLASVCKCGMKSSQRYRDGRT